jgi:HD superfamily phosphohydrolase
MVESLFLKCSDDVLHPKNKDFIFNNCRIAAILHDCGHGPFSHLSEQIYSSQFDTIKSSNPILRGASAHEMLSYFITTSPTLKRFNEEVIKGVYGVDIDLDFVGAMIVGYINKDDDKGKSRGFAIELISGAFDADKLDYILRDAHSTGIRMALDLPKLMYTLDIIPDENGINRLAIDISGVSALEEIVFNKMMLTSTIYHHQKVRAAGCMLKNIIENSGKFKDAIDFLDYTDDKVLNLAIDDDLFKGQLEMLKNRVIPKRAFCFSSRTLEDGTMQGKIMAKLENKGIRNHIIECIVEYLKDKMGINIQKEEIWIDSPASPKFKEATQCLIKSDGSPNNYISLREVFPTDDWVRAFSENKWQGFVYSMPENCVNVAKASKVIFEEIFETKFNSFATRLCKINDAI